MKFSCYKKDLNDALKIVMRAVMPKPKTPVLSGIYIKADDGQIELQATDNETGFITKIAAQTEIPGTILITGKYLQEVVTKLPDETVNFYHDYDRNTTLISTDSVRFTFLSMNPDDFPVITPVEGDVNFSIQNQTLKELIRKTAFACSTEETRPVFTGCYLEIKDNLITMAATNTHRLAVKSETYDYPIGNIKVNIPAKTLSGLASIIATENPVDVKVSIKDNKVGFTFENTYMFSQVISGDYPDYRNIIPNSFAIRATMNTGEFSRAIDRVSLISRTNEYNIVRMQFSDDKVIISSNNPEIGNAEENVHIQKEGEDINIAFNADYMIDVLKAIDNDTMYMSLNASLKPISIQDGDDKSFLYLATPVRTTH